MYSLKLKMHSLDNNAEPHGKEGGPHVVAPSRERLTDRANDSIYLLNDATAYLNPQAATVLSQVHLFSLPCRSNAFTCHKKSPYFISSYFLFDYMGGVKICFGVSVPHFVCRSGGGGG
jgi:hypothetical protein